jgi:hypothetical protein
MIGYVLTMISLIHALTGFVVSTIVVVATIHHRYHHRLKREEKITLLLSAYIYSFLFIYTIILIATNIQTLLGDVYGTNYDTSWCIFREYWITVIACALYYTFVVQVNTEVCIVIDSCETLLKSLRIYGIEWMILIKVNNCYYIRIFRLSFVFVVLCIQTTDGFDHTGSLSLVHLFKQY